MRGSLQGLQGARALMAISTRVAKTEALTAAVTLLGRGGRDSIGFQGVMTVQVFRDTRLSTG